MPYHLGTAAPYVSSKIATAPSTIGNDKARAVGAISASPLFNLASYTVTAEVTATLPDLSGVLPNGYDNVGTTTQDGYSVSVGFYIRTQAPVFTPTWEQPSSEFIGLNFVAIAPLYAMDNVTVVSPAVRKLGGVIMTPGSGNYLDPSWWSTARVLKLVITGTTYKLYADTQEIGSGSLPIPVGPYSGWTLGWFTGSPLGHMASAGSATLTNYEYQDNAV
jgi:hypothetical protein